jgi:hypothetical protein
MKMVIRSLTAVATAVLLLSGCGPAANGPATSLSNAGSSPSPRFTDAAQMPATTTTPTTTLSPVVAPDATVAPTTPLKSSTPKPAVAGTALAAVAKLTVKGRAPKTGYTRAQFGQAWFDTDRNGCDTRNDILRRDLGNRQMQNACKVLAGALAPDPYTDTTIRFVYGGASEVDIDHVVALSDAWQKGAASWSPGKRLALANDPLNLLAVDASTNRSKGDGDTATWLPPNKAYRCTYVARQVAVKGKYALWVTSAERDAMTRVLSTCPNMPLPGPGPASTVAALPAGSTVSNPPAVQPVPAPPAGAVYYANCTAVRAAGAAPIHRGDPGYASKLDRDGDGIGCE